MCLIKNFSCARIVCREIYVYLHLLSRAKAVSKKSIAILSFDRNFGRFYMKEDRAFMLSLDCVCYIPVAYLQA